MKSPDKPGPHVSGAKEAMADFYQELLGSLDKSPLAELTQLAQRELVQRETADAKPIVPASSTFKAALSRSVAQTSSGSSELRSRPLVSTPKLLMDRPVLVDAPVARGVLSSPVLQGALPKLAPEKAKKEAEREILELPVATVEVEVVRPDVIKVVSTRKGSDSLTAPQAAPESYAVPVSNKNLAWHDNGRPHWAQDRFECLLFVVAGLTLAVPLVSLGAIYRLDDELTPLVGRASWFMGLYRQGERSVQVVDTAQWVMPDRWTPEARDNYRFVIRLGDDNWGMATDAVQQSINLSPEQVKWRTERSKRSWLAGTVVDHMCALLDADKLAELLAQDAVRSRR